ncbi:hypothetical protein L6452_40360 [Arctium lappa]|uniref:Uncharacterized protein n=1 Tax=Arctium lappa TaxID=4217 RepID=A0ACB8XL36_ARCLA|nr:hypothetical protein L6452_40360 [Arctium lappa]
MVAVNNREIQITKKLFGMDMDSRVLRYREKRKKRKFEKKTRYASRNAYAEMRSRIKGRFAKGTKLTMELDVDRWEDFETKILKGFHGDGGLMVVWWRIIEIMVNNKVVDGDEDWE